MSSAAVTLPRANLAELLKLIGLPSEVSENDRAAEIAGRANELIRTVVSVVDDLVSVTIEKRTARDFISARSSIFPQYFLAMRALGDLARIVLPKNAVERLCMEWFCELESDFRDLGANAFGTDLTDRGMFTVWTLRKIHDLAIEIEASPSSSVDEAKDSERAMDFATKAMWTRFHVDCLTKSMRTKKPIYPEVVDPIRDGLRAAVNTYSCIRQWADHRHPRPAPQLDQVEWTDEDQLLLADSMRDLDQEVV